MPKKNKHPAESDPATGGSDSENYIENSKYMKMLKLQRSVLNKLVNADLNIPAHSADIENDNPEFNESFTNKNQL